MSTYPGSLDNGDTDAEFTPILQAVDGKFCAAEATWATKAELADVLVRLAKLEAEANAAAEDDAPPDLTAVYMLGMYDGRHGVPMPDDYIIVPTAEMAEQRAELEALRAFKASVPWKALVTTWLESEQGTPEWNDLHEFVSKHGPSGPVEYMQNGNAA